MAPTLLHHLVSKVTARSADAAGDILSNGPLAVRAVLGAREVTDLEKTRVGITKPKDINNNAMFAFFGLLGAAIVLTLIWFFFWAKNGGFFFKEHDWDDYKTTVLRRRGPNGTILSNATPSTNLGGGSIYKDVDDYTEDATTVTGGSELSGITGGVSDVSGRARRSKKREQREREKREKRDKEYRKEHKREHRSEKSGRSDKSGRGARSEKSEKSEKSDKSDKNDKSRDRAKKEKSRRKINQDGILVDEEAEAEAQTYLRNYRHEKPARVGGLNKASDSSAWDGSTNPSASTVVDSSVTSGLMSNREHTPTSTPTKKAARDAMGGTGGIRKVYSTADRNAERESERQRSERREARRQERQERQRASAAGGSRRDFSWQYGEDSSTPLRYMEDDIDSHVSSHITSSWTASNADSQSDVGTKAYHHVIPGLSSNSPGTGSGDLGNTNTKREERRKQRGYRRE